MRKGIAIWLALALLLSAGCQRIVVPHVTDAPDADAPMAETPSDGEAPVLVDASVAVRRAGKTVSERRLTGAEELEAAERIVFGHWVLSAAWEGAEASTLEDCVSLTLRYAGEDEAQSYYQYEVDGRPVLQGGESGMYTMMVEDNYRALMRLAGLAADMPEAYARILAQYADAEGADVALEWLVSPQPAYYALYDVDKNGADELLVLAGPDAEHLVYYDLWCLTDGGAVRPFDMDFGYRVNLDVYADGALAVRWSNSAFESGCDLYRLDGARAEAVSSLVAASDPESPGVMRYTGDGAEISGEEYDRRLAAFAAAGAPPLVPVPVMAP